MEWPSKVTAKDLTFRFILKVVLGKVVKEQGD